MSLVKLTEAELKNMKTEERRSALREVSDLFNQTFPPAFTSPTPDGGARTMRGIPTAGGFRRPTPEEEHIMGLMDRMIRGLLSGE